MLEHPWGAEIHLSPCSTQNFGLPGNGRETSHWMESGVLCTSHALIKVFTLIKILKTCTVKHNCYFLVHISLLESPLPNPVMSFSASKCGSNVLLKDFMDDGIVAFGIKRMMLGNPSPCPFSEGSLTGTWGFVLMPLLSDVVFDVSWYLYIICTVSTYIHSIRGYKTYSESKHLQLQRNDSLPACNGQGCCLCRLRVAWGGCGMICHDWGRVMIYTAPESARIPPP